MNSELNETLCNSCFFRHYLDALTLSEYEISDDSIRDEVHFEREILLIIRGVTEFSYCHRKLRLKAGDVLFINSWEPHQYGYERISGKCLHLWIHIHTEHVLASVVEVGGKFPMIQSLINLPDDLLPALNRRWNFAVAMRRKVSGVSEYYQSMIRLLQEELLWNALNPHVDSDRNNLEKRVKNFLSVNYGRRVTLSELENHFGCDKCYLSRLFKKAYGITIGEFIDHNRERYTKAALMRGMTQKEIAAQLGFSSASAFWLWRKRRHQKQNIQN